MVSVIYVHFSQLVGSCNLGTHLITLLNILSQDISWCIWTASVTSDWHMTQHRVSDTIMHTTLNTINDAFKMDKAYLYMGGSLFFKKGGG